MVWPVSSIMPIQGIAPSVLWATAGASIVWFVGGAMECKLRLISEETLKRAPSLKTLGGGQTPFPRPTGPARKLRSVGTPFRPRESDLD